MNNNQPFTREEFFAITEKVNNQLCDNIEEILDRLNVDYNIAGNRIYGPCPIHGGDNPEAFSLYLEGVNNIRGIWHCYTAACEEDYGKTPIGLIRGIMSRHSKRSISYLQAMKYAMELLGYKDTNLNNIKTTKLNPHSIHNNRLTTTINRINTLEYPKRDDQVYLSIEYHREKVKIPSQYYLKRGFSAKTLDKFSIGDCEKRGRTIVPVLNLDGKTIAGFTSRSIYEKCNNCGKFHSPKLNCPNNTVGYTKWVHSEGFNASKHLYGLWFAKEYIEKSSTMILTEGPGDVWRLYESGIYNAVALFGDSIKGHQRILIENIPMMNVIVLTDNDDAGKRAAQNIKKQLQRTHRLFFPLISSKDVGELHADEITTEIKPVISRIGCLLK